MFDLIIISSMYFFHIGIYRQELLERLEGDTLFMSVLQEIKNCLKRILPRPATSMLREMDVQNRRIDQLTAKVDSLNRTVNDLKKIIYKTNKPVYWHSEMEYRVVNSNWGRITERPDFKEKYLQLISGLDADSITIITRLLRVRRSIWNRDAQSQIFLLGRNRRRYVFQTKILQGRFSRFQILCMSTEIICCQ